MQGISEQRKRSRKGKPFITIDGPYAAACLAGAAYRKARADHLSGHNLDRPSGPSGRRRAYNWEASGGLQAFRVVVVGEGGADRWALRATRPDSRRRHRSRCRELARGR